MGRNDSENTYEIPSGLRRGHARVRRVGRGTGRRQQARRGLSRGHLVIGTGSTNAPWHFKSASDELQGFDVDMGHIVAEALFGDPDKIEFVIQSSDARIPNLTTGKVDLTCQFMTVTGERAQQVAFTIPYYREGVGLMMKAGGKYADYEALKAAGSDVTISVLQNVYAEDMVHKALPEAQVDQYDSVDLIYQALESGPRRCRGDRPVVAGLVHGAEPRPLRRCRLWLEPAVLCLRRRRGATWTGCTSSTRRCTRP